MSNNFLNDILEQGRQTNDSSFSLRQKTFAVPYLIWSNYKTNKDLLNVRVTSTNYLGALVHYYSGLPLTSYEHYLLQLRKRIPCINQHGYMNDNLDWFSLSSVSVKNTTLLSEYENLQYYLMFDITAVPNTGNQKKAPQQ